MKSVFFIALLSLALAGLAGCGGQMPQIHIGKDAQFIMAEEAGFELGIWATKKHPEGLETLSEFAGLLEVATASEAVDLSEIFGNAILSMCADDAIGKARAERLLRFVDVDLSVPAEKDKRLGELVRYLQAAGKGLKQALSIAGKPGS